MESNIFSGLGVALVTPFDSQGRVDLKSLERLLEHLLEPGGADFLVVHGTTGESPCLRRDERDLVTRHVVEITQGRCPIVVGLGGNDTAELAGRLREMDTTGIDGILSVVPYYNKPTQEGLYRHFSIVAEHAPLPVILYNVPGRVGVNMLPDTVCRLAAAHSNIVGVKEASGFPAQTEAIISGKVPEGFVVLSGDDALSIPIIRNGARGVISVGGNAYPRLFSRLIHLSMEGRYNEAEMIMLQLRDINSLLFANGNPTGIKALLYQMGIIEHNVLRLPLLPASREVYEGLMTARMQLEALVEDLG